MNQQTQLAIEAGPDDVIDSDEERNLLQEIKEEVQNRIRHELKDELNVFSDKYDQLTRLEQTAGQLADDDESRKIREGLAKIRKLDLILSKKVRREKEVKRDRILLERRLHKDLDELRAEGKISSHELLVNTDKFLALTLPESHNEGVIVDEPIPASPVFRTEVHETDDRKQSRPINEANRSTGPANSTRDNTVSPLSSADSIEELNLDSASGSATSSARRRTHSNKDFIKRNVQLAADADSSVPMTDDEKNRIKNLLQDLDTVPELPIDGTESVVSLEGEGFMLESDQQSHMSQIDNRLKALLPVDKFESICSTPVSCHSSHSIGQEMLFTRSRPRCDADFEHLGDIVLQDSHDHRELTKRLHVIEEQLQRMTNPVEFEPYTPCLTERDIQSLVDDCVYNLSQPPAHSVQRCTSDGSDSPVLGENIHDSPPRLSDDVLQQLLYEARSAQGDYSALASRLSHDQTKLAEDMGLDPITDDTWQVIFGDNTSSVGGSHGDVNSRPYSQASINSLSASILSPLEASESSYESDSSQPFLPRIHPGNTCLVSQSSHSPISGPQA